MARFTMLTGIMTYVASSCLLGLAIHHFASGKHEHGAHALLTATVACALRRAIAKIPS